MSTPLSDDDPRLAVLGREVERATRRVAAVEAHAAEIDALMRRLAEHVAVLAPDEEDEGPPGLRSWLAAEDPAQARIDLLALTEWIGAVYLRFPDATLPSCWAWHPTVVEELWWLRGAHQDAYHGRHASWRDVGDWHDRARPGVVRRVRAIANSCELALHVTDGRAAITALAAPLATALPAVAERWSLHRDTPQPTAQQLTDADHHDRAQMRAHQ